MVAIPQPQHTTLRAVERAVSDAADDGLRAHLGASIIGRKCARELWYTFRWVTLVEHEPRILRLFARGQREEATFVALLRAAGVTIHETDQNGEQFRFSTIGGHFGGSMDGCGVGFAEAPEKWHVVEFKTHGDKSFKDLQKKGVEASKPEHWSQMQIYMLLSGMERAFYLAVNKNDDELHAERIRFEAKKAEALLEKARRIIASDRPLEKLSQDPAWYECKFCDHQTVCHGQTVPLPTCRSCLHATAELDGDGRWSCVKHGVDLTVDQQKAGCDTHCYIPDLLANWATVEDASEDSVHYLNTLNGQKFTNGYADYSSLELYQARHALAMVGNVFVDTMKQEIDGRIESTEALSATA